MSTEDKILEHELDKLTKLASRYVGKITGDSEVAKAASLGGTFGVDLAAKYLPTEKFQTKLDLQTDAHMVLSRAHAFLSSNGRVTESEELVNSPHPTIAGVVGSGFLNKNPAILQVEILEIADNRCKVLVSAAAKEGLIKQRTAEKAVNRLIQFLSGELGCCSNQRRS